MKKYNKFIFILIAGVFLIGMTAILISGSQRKRKTAADGVEVASEAMKDSRQEIEKEEELLSSEELGKMEDGTEEASEMTVKEETADSEIRSLVTAYLNASVKADIDSIDELVLGESEVRSEELQSWYQNAQGYQNIRCYTVKNPEEEEYLAYIYAELKLKEISTAAPGLTSLVIKKDEDGILRIYQGLLSAQEQEFMEEADGLPEVQELIEKVNEKLREAVGSDEALMKFYQKLEE